MAETKPEQVLKIQLAENGGALTFENPEALTKWLKDENDRWLWLNQAGRPATDWVVHARNEFHQQLATRVNNWTSCARNSQDPRPVLAELVNTFQEYCGKGRVLISTHPGAVMVLQLREKRGDAVAAGAYAGILSAGVNTAGTTSAGFLEGIIESFLFKREVDWTATAHQQTLNRLQETYEGEIEKQRQKFQH